MVLVWCTQKLIHFSTCFTCKSNILNSSGEMFEKMWHFWVLKAFSGEYQDFMNWKTEYEFASLINNNISKVFPIIPGDPHYPIHQMWQASH